jgi:hypothetical protein
MQNFPLIPSVWKFPCADLEGVCLIFAPPNLVPNSSNERNSSNFKKFQGVSPLIPLALL